MLKVRNEHRNRQVVSALSVIPRRNIRGPVTKSICHQLLAIRELVNIFNEEETDEEQMDRQGKNPPREVRDR